ncbi:MAG: iron-sulfur cluster assembly accessory protein [Proteobacteria bacterium]|nr:iron-sulfur cluster assembly accessory protein [Pseudomonadota bacterium]
MKARTAPIRLSEAAVARLKALMATRGASCVGLRVGVATKGCSGLSYTMEFADKVDPGDEVIEQDGVRVLIDPKATMFLFGTTMDYVEDKLRSGFTFVNPNEKGRCGCGESFHV